MFRSSISGPRGFPDGLAAGKAPDRFRGSWDSRIRRSFSSYRRRPVSTAEMDPGLRRGHAVVNYAQLWNWTLADQLAASTRAAGAAASSLTRMRLAFRGRGAR